MTCIFYGEIKQLDGTTIGYCEGENEPGFDASKDCPNNWNCRVFE